MEQDSESTDIVITFETLFELLRNEKNKAELQELPSTFFFDVVNYLAEKQKIIEQDDGKNDVFASAERDKNLVQVENTKRILKELYERRETKIINMALSKSRTASSLTDLSHLLREEKELFNLLTGNLDKFRNGVLINIVSGKNPLLVSEIVGEKTCESELSGETTEKKEPEQEKETKLLRFLKPVPKFVGKELETYGPFDIEDVASLPIEIANVLVQKGRAEEMGES